MKRTFFPPAHSAFTLPLFVLLVLATGCPVGFVESTFDNATGESLELAVRLESEVGPSPTYVPEPVAFAENPIYRRPCPASHDLQLRVTLTSLEDGSIRLDEEIPIGCEKAIFQASLDSNGDIVLTRIASLYDDFP
jgi:hypothetical protein